MANFKVIHDTARFDRWKEILDRYEAGELTDAQASRALADLREKEQRQFEEPCLNQTIK